jgi:ATP-dependent protease Clp ATPase subunit
MLIAGPGSFICEDCVEVCIAILLDVNKKGWTTRINEVITGKRKHKIQDVKEKKTKSRSKK